MRKTIQILSILAFILVGISPACAFISGESSFMEICTSNGIERIAVNDSFDPSAPTPDQNHAEKPDCAFCFTQTHQKTFQTATLEIPAYDFAALDKIFSLESANIIRSEVGVQNPRGPPLLQI